MDDLPINLRTQLSQTYQIGNLKTITEQVSRDGTKKRAYELHDGQIIESVLMPYDDGRRTACISSQAGCAMGCVFCATGQMGFSRQLTSTEIFEQAQMFSSELKLKNERLSNIVLMGMGEPLANYDNVFEAIKRFQNELDIGFFFLFLTFFIYCIYLIYVCIYLFIYSYTFEYKYYIKYYLLIDKYYY